MTDKIYELMEKMYTEMQQGFTEVRTEIQEVKTEIKDLHKSQVRIENDHGEKLSALFDFQKSQEEINNQVLSALARIENKLETHDTQIHVLDKTKANIK